MNRSIYFNGKILTIDRKSSVQQAMCVEGDKFLSVGTNENVLKIANENTQKVDLFGKTVIPGINEGHAHPLMAGLSEMIEKIPNPRTIRELLEWIKFKASETPSGSWIIHPRCFATRLIECRFPTLREMDAVAPNHPVFLNGSFGGAVNSVALKVSGITRDTDNPGIIKDKTCGEPTGMLHRSAFALLKNRPCRKWSREQEKEALIKMIACYNKTGITSVNDTTWSSDSLSLYKELLGEKSLNARIYLNYWPGHNVKSKVDANDCCKKIGLKTGEGDEWIRMGPFKVYLDGGILTGTAYLSEPWGKIAGNIFGVADESYRGIINYTKQELDEIVSVVHEAGWKFIAHATGDGAVAMLLGAYEALSKRTGIKDLGFTVLHGNFVNPDILAKCKNMGIFLDIQAAWFYEDADSMTMMLGKERMKYYHAYHTILKMGLTMCSGSDHMEKLDSRDSINPYNPFLAIYAMTTHKTQRGNCHFPEECIRRMDALRTYTINNAVKSGEQAIKGSIEPGKFADFVILEKDFLECSDNELRDMEVLTTVLAGRTVYKKRDIGPPVTSN